MCVRMNFNNGHVIDNQCRVRDRGEDLISEEAGSRDHCAHARHAMSATTQIVRRSDVIEKRQEPLVRKAFRT